MTASPVRWWARYTWSSRGTSIERELPTGPRATWSIGTSRGVDVRLAGAARAFEVRLDWLGAWFVSAPGASRPSGAPLGPGSLLRHGDGLVVDELEMWLVRRGAWDEGLAFGALRESLHKRDWASAAQLLYAWPRGGSRDDFARAAAYARDLARGEALEAGNEQLGAGQRALWDEVTGRT